MNNVIETYREGKACVLTVTNDEALRVCSLLNKRGVRARLIQSPDGFKLRDLVEIRYFLKKIDERLQTAVVSDELWEYAKSELNKKYCDSACLEICNNVYMLLNNVRPDGGEQSRKLYVGITRAKNNLYIHCNSDIFDGYNIRDVEKNVDNKLYSELCEIALPLAHTDFYLDYFKNNKDLIFSLRSGMRLLVNNNRLIAEINGHNVCAVVFSKKRLKDIEAYKAKGYIPYAAQIKFIVAWKCKEDGVDYTVPLVDMFFRK